METELQDLEVERCVFHAQREGFRITELEISPVQSVPWHFHNHISDTFYVLEGEINLNLRNPKETIRLQPGCSFKVAEQRPHTVINGGDVNATFLVLQGIGEYDNVALPQKED